MTVFFLFIRIGLGMLLLLLLLLFKCEFYLIFLATLKNHRTGRIQGVSLLKQLAWKTNAETFEA